MAGGWPARFDALALPAGCKMLQVCRLPAVPLLCLPSLHLAHPRPLEADCVEGASESGQAPAQWRQLRAGVKGPASSSA